MLRDGERKFPINFFSHFVMSANTFNITICQVHAILSQQHHKFWNSIQTGSCRLLTYQITIIECWICRRAQSSVDNQRPKNKIILKHCSLHWSHSNSITKYWSKLNINNDQQQLNSMHRSNRLIWALIQILIKKQNEKSLNCWNLYASISGKRIEKFTFSDWAEFRNKQYQTT